MQVVMAGALAAAAIAGAAPPADPPSGISNGGFHVFRFGQPGDAEVQPPPAPQHLDDSIVRAVPPAKCADPKAAPKDKDACMRKIQVPSHRGR